MTNVTLRHLIIATVVGLIASFATWVVITTTFFESLALSWLTLNFLPFVVALYAENRHNPNLVVLYIACFIQWFLLTLCFFKLKRKLTRQREEKRAKETRNANNTLEREA